MKIVLPIVGGLVVLFFATGAFAQGMHRYKLWKADGIWCTTFDAAGNYVGSYYGAENCGQ